MIVILIMYLLLVWAGIGLYYFYIINKNASKVHSMAEDLYKKEQLSKNLTTSVKSYLPRIELENKYSYLIKIGEERKKRPIYYYVSNILKSIIIGPLYFIL